MIGWVGMGLTELVNLSVLRIFRVIRLLRAGRLLIIVPELYLLVCGLATSMKVGELGMMSHLSEISYEIAFFGDQTSIRCSILD